MPAATDGMKTVAVDRVCVEDWENEAARVASCRLTIIINGLLLCPGGWPGRISGVFFCRWVRMGVRQRKVM
jgi:hypothetical protein